MSIIPIVDNLIELKCIFQRSSDELGEIRQQLASHLANLGGRWSELPREFRNVETVFKDSEKDILELEEMLKNLASYFDVKINALVAYNDVWRKQGTCVALPWADLVHSENCKK
ncbi:MAG: hypothetical protein FWD60_04415 [Candidatus Azobacteroides sp.]|nr:hypothetical protein [Candidatus Azobacteroides sp.]